MGARTDFEPLTWEEAEQNFRETTARQLARLQNAAMLQPNGPQPGLATTLQVLQAAPAMREREASFRPQPPPAEDNSLAEECDRLRSEVKRGKEYLDQVRQDLAESRSCLEEWPTYERTCGRNPLAHLTQSVMVNERIEQFLTRWLKQREDKLETKSRELCAQPTASRRCRTQRRHRSLRRVR